MKKINKILKKYGIKKDQIINYGQYISKLDIDNNSTNNIDNKGIIVVTATSPTPAGEGKTTVAINLHDGMHKIRQKTVLCLREPSLGPCFGMKGGATGAGKASITPEEDINMHFTGDLHAITSANNLIASCIDNTIYWGNKLNLDPKKILFRRIMDMNDRSLRNIQVSINDKIKYNTCFDITAASELMTIFCISKNKQEFINNVNNIAIGFNKKGKIVTVKELNISNAIWTLIKQCFKPNAVQTLENNLTLISGGPFANISVGICSISSIFAGLNLGKYVITEAGFGADLGAEKFLNIITRQNNLPVKCIVLVTTIKSIYYQGNNNFEQGLKNLQVHLNHLNSYNLPVVVAINSFANDTKQDEYKLTSWLEKNNISYEFSKGFNLGGEGAKKLASLVLSKITKNSQEIKYLYNLKDNLKNKITKIATKAYGVDKIEFDKNALALIKKYEKLDFAICMSKNPTQLSNKVEKGKSILIVKDLLINYGSKLIVVMCNNVFRMPGLPKIPRAVTWK